MQILRTTLNQLLHAHNIMLPIKRHFEELAKSSTPLPMILADIKHCESVFYLSL